MLATFFSHAMGRLAFFVPACILLRLSYTPVRRLRGRRTTFWHEAGTAAFYCYLFLLGEVTVNYGCIVNGRFSLAESFNLIPFWGIVDIIATKSTYLVILNIAGNIILFMPLGFLLPLLWERWRSAKATVLLGAGLSFSIEFLQFFTSRGTDVDDLMLNTLGALWGYGVFLLTDRLFPELSNLALCSRAEPKGVLSYGSRAQKKA